MTDSKGPRPKKMSAEEAGSLGGKVGGRARAESLTATARSEIAREAARARWHQDVPKETHRGVLKIAEMELPCAVLDNQRRVIGQAAFWRQVALGRAGNKRKNEATNDDFDMLPFLAAANLQPFIPESLTRAAKPVVYRIPTGEGMRGGGGGGTIAHGIEATLIPEICDVWLKARAAGKLHYKQEEIAKKAELLMRGLARVGVVALVDEATGYQADRARDELSKILEAYIAEELRPWLRRFPHEFFKQIHRLWKWEYKEGSSQGPRYVGKIINDCIYRRLPPGVSDELARKNPATNGRRRHHHHRWLTDDTGIPHLDKQITAVTTLMVVSDDKAMFEALLRKRFPKKGEQLHLTPAVKTADEEE